MSFESQPNENTNLVNKIWKDDSTLEEIVKYEYKKVNKSKYAKEDVELLNKNRLISFGDWKELCTRFNAVERKNMTNAGLVLLLDKVAGIQPENVSSRKIKKIGTTWNKKKRRTI